MLQTGRQQNTSPSVGFSYFGCSANRLDVFFSEPFSEVHQIGWLSMYRFWMFSSHRKNKSRLNDDVGWHHCRTGKMGWRKRCHTETTACAYYVQWHWTHNRVVWMLGIFQLFYKRWRWKTMRHRFCTCFGDWWSPIIALLKIKYFPFKRNLSGTLNSNPIAQEKLPKIYSKMFCLIGTIFGWNPLSSRINSSHVFLWQCFWYISRHWNVGTDRRTVRWQMERSPVPLFVHNHQPLALFI